MTSAMNLKLQAWKRLIRKKTIGVVVAVLLISGVIYYIAWWPIFSQKSDYLKVRSHPRFSLTVRRSASSDKNSVTTEPATSTSVSTSMMEQEMEGQNDVKPRQEVEKTVEHVRPTEQSSRQRRREGCSKNIQVSDLARLTSSREKQQAVLDAFCHAWNGYKAYSWGFDELAPISKSSIHWFGLGVTIIDALDTMWIMNLTDEFKEAREWVATHLNFNQSVSVSLFETTIRLLGGLLSAYHLSHDHVFKNKAVDLADRLLGAFNSPSGIPYSDVNLQDRVGMHPDSSTESTTSEVATVQLEFRDLTRITGEAKYQEAVDHVLNVMDQQSVVDNLLPVSISPETGKFRESALITLGARGDSYYEYLLKQWIQSGKKENKFRDWYVQSMDGVQHKLIRRSKPHNLLFVGEMSEGRFSNKMDHLVCFLSGTLALGAHNGLNAFHMDIAKELLYTCVQMYERMETGLSPEMVYFNQDGASQEDIQVQSLDTHNLLRPETVESLFILYRLTRNNTYQDWGWTIFKAFENYTRVPSGGYSSIDNVRSPQNPQYRDKMESFFLAETLKYLYLLFEEDFTVLSLDKFVFNTEAHPLPIWN